ncbi:uncharacterized protein CIMG_08262 [Coccidioides immitis RS]|uniref:ABC transporter domain-containing protein n=1 Tax=Coccidioides immitis (strain RS) TaxID=246410 RepID=J3K552_COCIM|nr:uncharacterized protein CIMG_08262 [Coccidioides immitis RS]EAS29516.3 hypothetical protein CIMG_08262 [Coccidioides immitis RS]
MEGAFGRYLCSPLFTFTVSVDRQEVTVHSSALAGLSQNLNTLLNGKMIEAKTRHVVWPNVNQKGSFCKGQKKRVKGKKRSKKSCLVVSLDDPVLEAATKTELETELELEPEPEPDLPPEDFCNNSEILYKERSVWTRHLCNALQRVPGSKTVAFIGESGSKKSTILDLLLQVHFPQDSSIQINKHNISKSLKKEIIFVPQKPNFFSDHSIMKNLKYTNLNVKDTEIYNICCSLLIHNQIQ